VGVERAVEHKWSQSSGNYNTLGIQSNGRFFTTSCGSYLGQFLGAKKIDLEEDTNYGCEEKCRKLTR
jgi:hypothetical protein